MWRPRTYYEPEGVVGRTLLYVIVALLLVGSPTVSSAQQADFDIPNGHFYTQTAGDGPGGFRVTDDAAPFWTTFRQYGGVDILGYPVSRRFVLEGQPAQAFQKAVFHWRPDLGRVAFVNVFDELSKSGRDGWLRDVRLVPKPKPISDEDKLSFSVIIGRRQALLDAIPAMRAQYDAVDDPLTLFGLPTSPVEDVGTAFVIRLQRATFQQWKTDRPWARAGDIVVANGGDVAKEAGLFPKDSLLPEPASGTQSSPAPVESPVVTPFAGPTSTPTAKPAVAGVAGAVPTSTRLPATPTPGTPPSRPASSATPGPQGAVAPTASPFPGLPTLLGGSPPAGAVVIALDPGHGGPEIGAAARFDDGFVLREKDVNLTVAMKTADGLRDAGFWVVMTRDKDTQVNRASRDLNGDNAVDLRDELEARIDIANAAKANLFLSIHHNGHANADLNGLEVYTCRDRPFAESNQRIGVLVEQNVLREVRAAGYSLATRGQKDCYDPQVNKYYFVIGPIALGRPRATNMPGLIGEAMFITNRTEASQLRDDRILSAEARGYVEAIKRFFGR